MRCLAKSVIDFFYNHIHLSSIEQDSCRLENSKVAASAVDQGWNASIGVDLHRSKNRSHGSIKKAHLQEPWRLLLVFLHAR